MSSKALAAAKAALDAPPPFVYNRGDAFASLSKDARDRLEAASPRAPPGQPEGVALSHMASPPSQKQSFFSLYGSPRRRLRTGVPDYATLALEYADSRARVALAARERGEPEPVSPEPAHAALLASFGEGPGGHGVHATFLTLSGDVDGSVTGGDSGEDLSNCSEGCADADVDAPATVALEAETLPPPPMVTESGVSLATARYHGHRTRRAAPSDTTRAKPSPRYKDATASTIINRTLTHLRLRAQRHEEGQDKDGAVALPPLPSPSPSVLGVDAALWAESRAQDNATARRRAAGEAFIAAQRPAAAAHAARRRRAAQREAEERARWEAVDASVRRRISAALTAKAPARLEEYKQRLAERRERAKELRGEQGGFHFLATNARTHNSGDVVHHTN